MKLLYLFLIMLSAGTISGNEIVLSKIKQSGKDKTIVIETNSRVKGFLYQ